MKVADDLIAMNLDISDREALAERLAAIKPPEIQALKTNKGEDSGKIAALQMQIKQLTDQLQKNENENTVKIEIERLRNETALMVEHIKHLSSVYKTEATNKTRLDDTELRAHASLLENHIKPPKILDEGVKDSIEDGLSEKRI
jgi:hypothetical protein